MAFVTISEGLGVTEADLQAFNDAWMTDGARGGDLSRATQNFTDPFTPDTWITGDDMQAMVRMYELTHNRIYLDHLRDLSRDGEYLRHHVDNTLGA